MVIHGPKSTDYDIDIGPVMLSDHFHTYYLDLIEQVYHSSEDGPILPPMATNMLIQGKVSLSRMISLLTCGLDCASRPMVHKCLWFGLSI